MDMCAVQKTPHVKKLGNQWLDLETLYSHRRLYQNYSYIFIYVFRKQLCQNVKWCMWRLCVLVTTQAAQSLHSSNQYFFIARTHFTFISLLTLLLKSSFKHCFTLGVYHKVWFEVQLVQLNKLTHENIISIN